MPEYQTLVFTSEFMASLAALSTSDLRRVARALGQLDENEQHPSLRAHPLTGQQAGQWSASASRSLRITFERLDGGRKRLLACSHHYSD